MIQLPSSSTAENFEMRSLSSRPLSRYDETYVMFDNYDIRKAEQVVNAQDWANAEPFLNPWGSQRVTLVHFAACRRNLRMLESAVALGASMYTTDEYGRCALHFAADRGHDDVVKWLLEHPNIDERPIGTEASTHPQLSLPDHHGRTALHQAVKEKHVAVVKLLVNAGANVNAKDEQGVPPFLMAHHGVVRNDPLMVSQYEKIVDILAAGWASVTIIHPLTGWSVLHYAVTLNSFRATHRLIKCGANPTCCRKGRSKTTPVHLAARFGYHQTLRILLRNLPPAEIELLDEYGWSPLHLAAVLGNLECVRILVDKGGNLAKKSCQGHTVIELLCMFKHDADLVNFFTDMLNEKVRLVDRFKIPAQVVHKIIVDFQPLAPESEPQMAVVSALIQGLPRTERIAILQHPVLVVYLGQKWSHLRCLFYSFVVVQVVFASILSSYGMVLLRQDLDPSIPRRILLFSACIPFSQNLLMFFTEPRRYCEQFENWLSLISVTMSIVVAVAGEFTRNPKMTNAMFGNPDDSIHPSWVLQTVSVAILLAWIQVMLLAGRFPAWGFFALMFSTVLKNVLKILFIGAGIIVNFALSFSLLFRDKDHFDNLFDAFVKTVVMMTGEYDYGDLFDPNRTNSTTRNLRPDDSRNTVLPIISKLVFLLFLVLVSIVLMNLMIGLAVSDIRGLIEKGLFSRLLKQAEFIANCERMTTTKIFQSLLVPIRLTEMLKSIIDTKKNLSWHWGQKRHDYISEKLWKNLFKLGLKNGKVDTRFELINRCSKNIDSIISEVTVRRRCRTLDDELENVYDYYDL